MSRRISQSASTVPTSRVATLSTYSQPHAVGERPRVPSCRSPPTRSARTRGMRATPTSSVCAMREDVARIRGRLLSASAGPTSRSGRLCPVPASSRCRTRRRAAGSPIGRGRASAPCCDRRRGLGRDRGSRGRGPETRRECPIGTDRRSARRARDRSYRRQALRRTHGLRDELAHTSRRSGRSACTLETRG